MILLNIMANFAVFIGNSLIPCLCQALWLVQIDREIWLMPQRLFLLGQLLPSLQHLLSVSLSLNCMVYCDVIGI